jgi:hypothetical protein
MREKDACSVKNVVDFNLGSRRNMMMARLWNGAIDRFADPFHPNQLQIH